MGGMIGASVYVVEALYVRLINWFCGNNDIFLEGELFTVIYMGKGDWKGKMKTHFLQNLEIKFDSESER